MHQLRYSQCPHFYRVVTFRIFVAGQYLNIIIEYCDEINHVSTCILFLFFIERTQADILSTIVILRMI